MDIKKILVPVDFSEFSDLAVEYALFMAEKFGADLTIFHTILLFHHDIQEKAHLQNHENIIKHKEEEINIRFTSQCSALQKKGFKVNSVLQRDFSAANSILNYLQEHNYDLLVIGTHGHTGLKRWLLGSVAEKVIHLSPIPVITVHKSFFKEIIKKILVPIDFSQYSKFAFKLAKVISKNFKAGLEFLHVVEEEAHPEFYNIASEPILEANPTLEKHILGNLIKFTGISENEAKYSVKEGKVAEEIRNYVLENQIDLIVMSVRGMGKLEQIVLGSNTERVVRIAPCPVLTARQGSLEGK